MRDDEESATLYQIHDVIKQRTLLLSCIKSRSLCQNYEFPLNSHLNNQGYSTLVVSIFHPVAVL